jgi:hypothetical protein
VTPLLSIAVGLVIAAFSWLLLLALVSATVLLILLALLVLDHLLQRNGVDRRAGVVRAWARMRGPKSARRTAPAAAAAKHGDDTTPAPAPRVPFSARRPGRAARPETSTSTSTSTTKPAPAIAVTAAPEHRDAVVEPEPPAAHTPAAPGAPEAPAQAVTEVLPTKAPTRSANATTRAPRAQAPRTRAPRASKPALRGPAAAVPPPASASASGATGATAPETDTPSGDRDSAIDRLFAPLLESDRTEPLPRARPARRPDGDA